MMVGVGGGGDNDGNRTFKLSSLHLEHDLWGTQSMPKPEDQVPFN